MRLRLAHAGPHPLLLTAVMDGRTISGTVVIDVSRAPALAPRPATSVHVARRAHPPAATSGARILRGPIAHAAGDPGVTVVDFAFDPATTTIHVGDTVTWTNTGNAPHTATANNGSFNTPLLQHGQSASHTFSQPGTYTYYCTVHPFMKGTIVVLASTSSQSTTSTSTTAGNGASGGSSSGSGSSGTTGSTSTGAGHSTLPYTGLDLAGLTWIGLLMLGAGTLLRRAWR